MLSTHTLLTYLVTLTFLLTPLCVFGQDTLELEPAADIQANHIFSLKNDLMLCGHSNLDHTEYLSVYNISNPEEPELVDDFYALYMGMDIPEHTTTDEITGAALYEDYIYWITSHRRTSFNKGYYCGPVVLYGRRIGSDNIFLSSTVRGITYDSRVSFWSGNIISFDNYMVVCCKTNDIRIYDLTEPVNPVLINVLEFMSGYLFNMDDRLLIAYSNGLRMIDLSDPENPAPFPMFTYISEDRPYYLSQKVIYNGHLLLKNYPQLDSTNFLMAIDLTQDDSLFETTKIELGGEPENFTFDIFDDKLYVYRYDQDIVDVYGIGDQFDINLIATLSLEEFNFSQFMVRNDKIFLANRYERALEHRYEQTLIYNISPVAVSSENNIPLPSSFSLNCYPNPFNSSTTIEYSVGANSNSPIMLSLYDLSGRLVQTLVNERLMPGNYRTTLNANGLASGVYVVRLDPPQPPLERGVQSRKLVVVK